MIEKLKFLSDVFRHNSLHMNTFTAHGNWYIKPIELPNADEYLFDLYNISLANTGFVHAWDSNLFFDEAIQLIANAIKLFQLGYFDCAFYSLRQSIETSIGTIYLTETPEKKSNWDDLQSGFESGTMSNELKNKETDFKDIAQKMPRFFDNIRNAQKSINKYVHKQGASSFYSIRKNPFLLKRKHIAEGQLLNDFEDFLKVCIGAVAVYRLSIDALPVVLMDEDMLYRSGDFITTPYSEEFVDKYIGKDNIEAFKTTQIYNDFCASLKENEKQNEAVFNLIHWNYYDRSRMDDYEAQLHLCSFTDRIVMCLCIVSTKISQVFVDGIHWYYTDVNSNNENKTVTFGSTYFEDFFSNTKNDYNQCYYNVFLSRCLVNGNYTYFEHNEELTEDEIENIRLIVAKLTELASQIEKELSALITINQNHNSN